MLRTPTFVSAMRRHVLPFLLSILLPCFAKADLVISPVVTQDGNDVYVDFVVNNFTDILSMQFTVQWDPTIMEFESITDYLLVGLGPTNFSSNPNTLGNGYLTNSWLEPTVTIGVTLPDCSTIFRAHFISTNGQVPDIKIGGALTPVEIVTITNGNVDFIGLEQGIGCNGQSRVSGLIYNDTNENCQMDEGEEGFPDCQVKVERNGQSQYVSANAKGEYYFIGPAGDYTLSAILPENVQLLPCEPTVTLSLGENELVELLFGSNTTGGNSVSGTHDEVASLPFLQASPNPLPIGRALTVTTSGPADLQLYDVSGRFVRQWAHGGTGEISLGQQTGAYLLKATAQDGSSQTIKLVVF
jgi:hypothetical protein